MIGLWAGGYFDPCLFFSVVVVVVVSCVCQLFLLISAQDSSWSLVWSLVPAFLFLLEVGRVMGWWVGGWVSHDFLLFLSFVVYS